VKQATIIAASILFALSATTASAATYQHTVNNGNFGNGGTFDQLQTSYDTSTEQLTWSLTNGQIGTDAVTGFWLVLNDGPNPKKSGPSELAILYADFSNNKLLAYAYNGANNPNSINDQNGFIGDFSSSLVKTSDSIGFNLDVSSINAFSAAPDWKGMQYDDELGIWFHVTVDYAITGDGQQSPFGFLKGDNGKQDWFDTDGDNPIETTVVPIPAAAFLFAPVLAGFIGLRRKLVKAS
jgi:hypothetical protein